MNRGLVRRFEVIQLHCVRTGQGNLQAGASCNRLTRFFGKFTNSLKPGIITGAGGKSFRCTSTSDWRNMLKKCEDQILKTHRESINHDRLLL